MFAWIICLSVCLDHNLFVTETWDYIEIKDKQWEKCDTPCKLYVLNTYHPCFVGGIVRRHVCTYQGNLLYMYCLQEAKGCQADISCNMTMYLLGPSAAVVAGWPCVYSVIWLFFKNAWKGCLYKSKGFYSHYQSSLCVPKIARIFFHILRITY